MTEDGKGDATMDYSTITSDNFNYADVLTLLAEVERLTRERDAAFNDGLRIARDGLPAHLAGQGTDDLLALVERLTGERASILSKHQSIIAGFEKTEELLGIKNAGLMDEVERLTAEVGRLSGLVSAARQFAAQVLEGDSYGCENGPMDCLHWDAKQLLDKLDALAALREDGEAETLHLEGCTLPGGHEGPCDGGEV